MKHLKIYEDYGFDNKIIAHEDDDLFDELVTQLGTNVVWNNDKNYWRRYTESRQDGFHIRWKNQEPLKLEDEDMDGRKKISERYFEIEKITNSLKNILDRLIPDKYNCWLETVGDKLDVSEEKIKTLFDKLESLEDNRSKENKKEWKEKKKIATFAALRKREDEIIDKDAKKYNV